MKIGDRVKIVNNNDEIYFIVINSINLLGHSISISGKGDKAFKNHHFYMDYIKSIELCKPKISDLKPGQKFKCSSFANKDMVYTVITPGLSFFAKFNFIDSNYKYAQCDSDYEVEIVE